MRSIRTRLIPRALRTVPLVPVVGAILLCFPPLRAQSHQAFPSPRSTSRSPDGQHVIHNVDYNTKEPYHRLLLEDTKTHTTRKLLTYERWVDVFWSPSGAEVMVDDHGGSDFENTYIYSVQDTSHRVDIGEEFRRQNPSGRLLFKKNDHVYVDGLGWVNETTVKIRLWGYGEHDPKGFERLLEYKLNGGIKITPE